MSNATHETVRVEDVGFAYRRFGRRGGLPSCFSITSPRTWTTGTQR